MGVPKRKNGLSSPKLPLPCNSLPDLKKLCLPIFMLPLCATQYHVCRKSLCKLSVEWLEQSQVTFSLQQPPRLEETVCPFLCYHYAQHNTMYVENLYVS